MDTFPTIAPLYALGISLYYILTKESYCSFFFLKKRKRITGHQTFNPLSPDICPTNSPNWSPYISLKNELREFDKRSKIFLFKIILSILVDFALDNLWLSVGENWFWTLLGHKGLKEKMKIYWSFSLQTCANHAWNYALLGVKMRKKYSQFSHDVTSIQTKSYLLFWVFTFMRSNSS